MPIYVNAFNDPAIEMFLTRVRECSMTPAPFSAIKLEDIFYPSELDDLYEEEIGNIFTNMRLPPPTVTEFVSVPVQVINLSTKFQKRLIIVAIAERHYASVSHDLKLTMMKWKVLKDLYL